MQDLVLNVFAYLVVIILFLSGNVCMLIGGTWKNLGYTDYDCRSTDSSSMDFIKVGDIIKHFIDV